MAGLGIVSLSLIVTVIGLVILFLTCVCGLSCIHVCKDPKNIKRIILSAIRFTALIFGSLVTITIFSVTVAMYVDPKFAR